MVRPWETIGPLSPKEEKERRERKKERSTLIHGVNREGAKQKDSNEVEDVAGAQDEGGQRG